jgi:hypothetical protein
MMIQKMSNGRRQQASRSRPTPDNLLPFIDMANALPAPEKLPGAVEGDFRDHYWDRDEDVEALAAQFKSFQAYLKGADLSAELPVETVRLCKSLSTIRAVLRTIARKDKSELANGNLLIGSQIEDFVSGHADQDGKFRVEHHPLLRALEGVELVRIRECHICGKIFWAGRIDQLCCTTRCAKVLRTRRWRECYPERYKQQRYVKAQAQPKKNYEVARDEVERRRLEPVKAASSARRPARLPVRRSEKLPPD